MRYISVQETERLGAAPLKTRHKPPLKDAWFIWFMLGVVMLNYPFLHIFNKNVQILGVPLTILYFFIGWPVSIFVIYLFSNYLVRHAQTDPPGDDKKSNPHGTTL